MACNDHGSTAKCFFLEQIARRNCDYTVLENHPIDRDWRKYMFEHPASPRSHPHGKYLLDVLQAYRGDLLPSVNSRQLMDNFLDS